MSDALALQRWGGEDDIELTGAGREVMHEVFGNSTTRRD